MRQSIIPTFDTFPKEAKVVGELVAGYGELEFELLMLLRTTLNDADTAVRVLFRTRGEEARIQIADGVMRTIFEKVGLLAPYQEAIADLSWCRRIRNQYAHCSWEVINNALAPLQFVDFDELAKQHGEIHVHRHSIDLGLLERQAEYSFLCGTAFGICGMSTCGRWGNQPATLIHCRKN